jgi:sugar phosphate isomerase/epimerase
MLAEVAAETAPLNVHVLLEFNWGSIKSVAAAAEIVRLSGAANAGVLFDPAHYYCTPSKLDQLTMENIATIKHVHVDNMRPIPPEISNCNSDRVLPDDPSGALDLKELFGRLEAGGYDGNFSIEMFSKELWAMEASVAAKRMYESLQVLLD